MLVEVVLEQGLRRSSVHLACNRFVPISSLRLQVIRSLCPLRRGWLDVPQVSLPVTHSGSLHGTGELSIARDSVQLVGVANLQTDNAAIAFACGGANRNQFAVDS